ncbi:MAG: hypothetical protein ACTSP4_02635 [Candidatus Hodarchaeales archaeon]
MPETMKEEQYKDPPLTVFREKTTPFIDRKIIIAQYRSNRNQWRWKILIRLLYSMFQVNITGIDTDRLTLLMKDLGDNIINQQLEEQRLLAQIYNYTSKLCHVQLRITKMAESHDDHHYYSLSIY